MVGASDGADCSPDVACGDLFVVHGFPEGVAVVFGEHVDPGVESALFACDGWDVVE